MKRGVKLTPGGLGVKNLVRRESFSPHLLIAERCLIWTDDKRPPNENVDRHASREMCSPEVSDIHIRRIYKVNRLSAIGHLPIRCK